ncbi:GPI-anchored cell wall organization protein ecm33 [Xylariaceae sp. FL0255]|nr:GPI-anchored cell wall organization protein ecm33 [Xylariaceae sp. FL0255]
MQFKMYSKDILSVTAAFGLLSGVAALSCSDTTVTINSQGDATAAAACSTIKGDVVLGSGAGPTIDLGGQLSKIGGSLTAESNGLIQTLQSSSLQSIGNTFKLFNLTALNTLNFPELGSVGEIDWQTLNALPEPTLGTPGITSAQTVTISDTFLQNIDGINVQSLASLTLSENRRLSTFTSSIKTLSDVMLVTANGLNLTMELPNLLWAANLTISNVSSISIPSLATINGSIRFDSSYFNNFAAPNLTDIQQGDLSFVSCPYVTNISFPQLTKIGGGLTIANNTGLEKVDGLNDLQQVGGAIIIRGSLDEIDLPSLNNVVGTATFISTGDITSSCNTLEGLSGSVIQGTVTACQSNNSAANNDTTSAGGGDNSGSGSGGTSAASFARVSMPTLVSLAALGGLVAAFL